MKTNRNKLIASVSVVVLLSVAGLFVWSAIQERARAAKLESEILKELKPEQVADVLKSEAATDAPAIRELTESEEKRKSFLDGLEEHLSLAGEARREGFAETEEFGINLRYKKDILLADLYRAKLSKGKDRLYIVPEKDLEKVWKSPDMVREFNTTMDVLHRLRKRAAEAKGDQVPVRQLRGDALKKARKNFAEAKALAGMARNDKEFMAQPVIELRIKILEAGLLANDLLIANYGSFRATTDEVRAYLASHPELNPKRKLKMARKVLAKAKAGEDFAGLAEKYSEDARSSFRGGLYEDVGAGVLWPEVEAAALRMKPGEMAPELVETEMGYHILLLVDNKTAANSGKTKYSVRHIVFQRKFEEPGPPLPGMRRPFMTPEEIARQEIERKKREEFIEMVKARSPVSVPDDVILNL